MIQCGVWPYWNWWYEPVLTQCGGDCVEQWFTLPVPGGLSGDCSDALLFWKNCFLTWHCGSTEATEESTIDYLTVWWPVLRTDTDCYERLPVVTVRCRPVRYIVVYSVLCHCCYSRLMMRHLMEWPTPITIGGDTIVEGDADTVLWPVIVVVLMRIWPHSVYPVFGTVPHLTAVTTFTLTELTIVVVDGPTITIAAGVGFRESIIDISTYVYAEAYSVTLFVTLF